MNSVFLEYPLVSVFIAVIVMIVLINIFSPKRPRIGPGGFGGTMPPGLGPRTCRGCGAEHPPHAVYCRKCGNRL